MSRNNKIDPRQPFYLAGTAINADGTCEFGVDGSEAFTGEAAAIEFATEQIEEHGGSYFIFRCVPIKRLTAYRVKVEHFDHSDDVVGNAQRVMREATRTGKAEP